MDSLQDILEALKDSKVYDLGTEFFVGMPRRTSAPPFSFSLLRCHKSSPNPKNFSSAACFFSMGGHTGTHIDAFNHVAKDGRVYGRNESVFEHESYGEGVALGSIEETPPIIQRGILLDIPRIKKVDVLNPNDVVSAEDLSRAEKIENVQIGEGDVVLIRTGWMRYWKESPSRFNSPDDVVPGMGISAGKWLMDRQISLTGSDTTAYEKVDQTKLALHTLFLNGLGIQIIENLYLEQLAKERVYEFIFISLSLKIRGGTASPIRPIAVVCEA